MAYEDWICNGCGKKQFQVEVAERYSLGIYAGKYCDPCWLKSGYRKEDREAYNFYDAGEYYGPDDY